MKTMKHTGKKALSVFLAVLMVMTAWVFVAPTEVSAESSATIAGANTTAVSSFKDADFNTSFTTVSGNFQGDNASTMASRGYYKNVLYSPHFPASNNNLNNSDAGVYFGTLGGKADGARVWYPDTTLIWDGSTTPQIPILFDIDSNSNNRVGVKNVYISSGANGLSFKDSYWTAKSECAKDKNYYTHFTFDWIMQNNSGNYWISTSSSNDKESECAKKGYWDIYGTYLQYTGGSFGSGNTYYKEITPTWVCRTGSNYTGTTNKTIYVIDYEPLKNALNHVKNLINDVKNNPSKYTTASVSALVDAANKLVAAKPNNFINSSSNNVYGWNTAVSTALSAYNSAKNLAVQKYNLKFINADNTTVYDVSYNYGASVDCANIAAGYSNTIKQYNDKSHQIYKWDNSKFVSTITDDVTIKEIFSTSVAHDFGSYIQGETDHSRTCSVCQYVEKEAHVEDNGTIDREETCTTDGIKTYDCSICGKTDIRTETIDKITGHDFSSEAIENEKGENGNHWRKCLHCDAYGWLGVENACDSHNWDKNTDGEVNGKDATYSEASTCEKEGFETYTCKVCSATWTKTLSLAEHTITATAAKDVTNVCGGDGNLAFWKCSVCNRVWKDEALTEEVTDLTDADGDNIPDVLETKGPDHVFTGICVPETAGANGTHKRQCVRFTQCHTYSEEEPHNYGTPVVTKTATCTAEGVKTYTCADCSQSYTESIPKVAHSMTKTAAVAATYTTGGNNEYYYCSACSKYYKNADGTTETTLAAETIAALKHTFIAGGDLQNPEKDRLISAATCMAAATYRVTCDRCSEESSDGVYSYGSADTLNGHKFNGEIKKNDDGTHSYKCTVEGCPDYGNATTCTYEVTEDVASTCKTAGHTTYTCTTCGNGYSDTKALDPNNHKGEGTKTEGAFDAKCNTDGYTGDTYCLGCNTKIATGTAIEADKTVHPHEDMKDYEAKTPTCQTEGWKEYKYCSACGTYEIKKVTVPVKAHSFTKYTTNNNGTHTAICDTCDEAIAAKATDTKDCSGGTANCVDKKVCTVCKTAYGEVDSANHKKVVTKAKVPATCQTEGKEAYRYCEACKTALEEIVKIEKLDHNYGDWSKIEGEDKHTRSCTTCDADVADVATETADCYGGTANCVDKAKCTACKAEYGELDRDNHSTEANTLKDAVAATCQKEGFSGNYHYDCCNAIKEAGEETPKLDHSFTELVSRELATCIKEGSETYKCSTCVESVAEPATNTTVLPINAKNHASTETKTVGYIAATCKDDGYTGDKYYTCCYDETKTAEENKKALAERGSVIKADGNNHTDLKVFDAVPATCQKAGNRAYSHCSTCNTYLINGERVTYDQTRVATIPHEFTTYVTNGNGTHTATCETCDANVATPATDTKKCSGGKANCTDLAECSVCKGTYGKVDATTHKTVKNFEKFDSTCQTEGYEAYQYCEACDKNITEMKIISKKAHDFGEWTPVEGKDEHTRSCTSCKAELGEIATETEDCKGGTATCKNKAECSVCAQKYGAINPNNHISDEVVTEERVEATCQKDGWTGREYYKCCYVAGANNTAALKNPGTTLPKVAHKYVEVKGTRVPATCLKKGTVSYECSTCDPAVEAVATKVEVLKEDKNNHASEDIKVVGEVKATCATDGYSGDKYHACCYDINKTTSLIQKGYKIPATGDHKLIKPVPEYLVEYTETDGVITGYTKKADTLSYEEKIKFRHEDDNKWYHVQICEDCGKIVKGACFTYEHTSTCTTTDSCEICEGLCSLVNPKNHGGNLILIPAVPATGNTPGTIAHYKCNACDKLFFDEAGQKQVENLKDLEIEVTIEHEINEEIPAKPNGDGTHSYTCGHCGEPIVEDCSGGTADCHNKAKCSTCGQEYGEIDATKHMSNELVIVGKKDATCSDSGYTGDAYYKCCYVEGAVDNTKALKAKGKEIPNDPSLHVMKLKDNLDGTHTEYCEGCGKYELPAVVHIWVAGNVPETASCTEGYDLGYTCICGATKTERVVAKHDYAETVKENPADCTTEGKKIITKTCKVCGATETVTETIAALGHDKRTIKGIPATCSTNGSTDYIYCNRCDTVLQDTTVIPATGCEDKNNDGYCDSCGTYLRINEDGSNCGCICHKKNGFMQLLYKFLNFFWKLFKIEKTCDCGTVTHW